MFCRQLCHMSLVFLPELHPEPVHHVVSVLLIDPLRPPCRDRDVLRLKMNLLYELNTFFPLCALPGRRLLLLLVELFYHLPHLGAELRVGRPQLVLALFQLLILLL